MDPRPVGVFDSGVGGLTVLHECLVTMPHEDFVYLGDHARLPYGPRPLPEIRRYAREIGAFLQAQDVKLILVACNAATSAALPELQAELSVPVVGVISPEAHTAVQATRCAEEGDCYQDLPWNLNVPQFIQVDLVAKRLSTTKASGENRSTPIEYLKRAGGVIVLQGFEGGRAFSFVISEATGMLSAAVAAEGKAVVVFGACTTNTAGPGR